MDTGFPKRKGQRKGNGGILRKIPEKYWLEMYQMFAGGMPIKTIHEEYVMKKWKIECSLSTVGDLIGALRIAKSERLNAIIDQYSAGDLGRLDWLKNELEGMAIELRFENKELFLKCADRLIKIYELKLTLHNRMAGLDPNADIGKDMLTGSLQQLIAQAYMATGKTATGESISVDIPVVDSIGIDNKPGNNN